MRRGSLPRATKPRPTPDRATDSHNHVEVVAVFKWRLDNHHAACDAHGVRIGPTSATNFCQHRCSADCTLFETPPAILTLRVSNHARRLGSDHRPSATPTTQLFTVIPGRVVRPNGATRACDLLFVLVMIHNTFIHCHPAFPSPAPLTRDAVTPAAPDVPPTPGAAFQSALPRADSPPLVPITDTATSTPTSTAQ